MKPFNLEAALNGAKVVTRDGREVSQLVWFDCANKHCLQGVIGDWLFSWTFEGKFMGDEIEDHDKDLFMATTKHEGWINLYGCGEAGVIYDTLEEAVGQAEGGCIATVRVEWES